MLSRPTLNASFVFGDPGKASYGPRSALHWLLRYFVVRLAVSIVFFASLAAGAQEPAQKPAEEPAPAAAAAETTQPADSQPVDEAEAAIASSDWKTAETKLDPVARRSPRPMHALSSTPATSPTRKIVGRRGRALPPRHRADPKSFEAHLSSGPAPRA
jgi:hypothetical protein